MEKFYSLNCFTHFYLFNMKRTFATQGKSLFAMLLVLVGMFFAFSAQAQQSLNGSSAAGSITFKAPSEVMQIAKDNVGYWHGQILSNPQTPGTTGYNNQMRNAAYYKAVFQEVSNGESVGTAIENALGAAATLGGEKEAAFTSKTALNAIKEEAIELFKL